MQIRDLDRFGIPAGVISRWEKAQGTGLLPVQRRALKKGLLTVDGKEERNLLILAPTSSGKSFCAEMAAVQALCRRRRVVWLVPLKSLAEQTYQTLERRYSSLGIDCLVVTADHPENDIALRTGAYQIAVVVYEKFDSLVTADLDRLANVGLLIIDELQMVGDHDRGPVLERLVTKVRASCYTPRIVGLSAVIGEVSSGALSRWLDADIVEEHGRPVDLYRGVAAEGEYRYRSFNNGIDGVESFAPLESGEDQLDAFVNHLAARSGSTLVFLKSRSETVNLAFRLAASVNWPEAADALAQLEDEEPSYLTRSLNQALAHGVAFHNADLSARQRSIVENAFMHKQVRVLFSTTTLAMGINQPADAVYLETVKYGGGDYEGRPTLVPISRAEFENMAGRAGRLGLTGEEFGRAIVLADNEFDREVLWETYIASAEPDEVISQLNSRPAVDTVLDFVTAGLVSAPRDLPAVLGHTLAANSHDSGLPEMTAAFDRLVEAGLIRGNVSGDRYTVTPTGRAVAEAGLSVRTGGYFRQVIDERGYPESAFGWLALALSTDEWRPAAGILSSREFAQQTPVQTLYQRFDHAVSDAAWLLPQSHREEPLSYHQAAALKVILLLDEWVRLVPVQRLEERYQLHLGQIMTLGEQASHLVRGLASLIESTDRESSVPARLRSLAFSLTAGLPAGCEKLHKRLTPPVSRRDYASLRNFGVETAADFAALTDEQLGEVFAGRRKLLEIKQLRDELKGEDKMKQAATQSPAAISAGLEMLEIDGSQDKERFVVKINGCPVKLTGKSFKYFTKLAWSRANRESGWVYKEDIEAGFNQARYLYRMKNELTAGLGLDCSLIENNRLGYYRLDIDPAKIRFNRENLREHPDWEVRQLFEQMDPERVGQSGGMMH